MNTVTLPPNTALPKRKNGRSTPEMIGLISAEKVNAAWKTIGA